MPLQTRDLVMIGLGCDGDTPVNSLQSDPLGNGIHLRWGFGTSRGFPWDGFLLFRREARVGQPILAGFQEIPPGSTSASTAAGTLLSDTPLTTTDDFGPAGQPEIPLVGRSHLTLDVGATGPSRSATVTLGFRSAGTVEISLWLWGQPILAQQVQGQAGAVHTVNLEVDAFTAIRVEGGSDVVVIEIGHVPVAQEALMDWAVAPNAPEPIGLPVLHPDYGPTGNQAIDVPASEQLATARIVYGGTGPWQGQPFTDLHGQLVALVAGGAAAGSMASRGGPVGGVAPGATGTLPSMPLQRPLDLVLLAALHPAMAQMLGLYWLDDTANPGDTFDYLIVADPGLYAGDANKLLSDLDQAPDAATAFANLDAFICFGLEAKSVATLPAPSDGRAYALPGATFTRQDGQLATDTNAAGVTFALDRTGQGARTPLRPDGLVLHHVWRARLGASAPASPPPTSSYDALTKDRPLLIVDPPGPAAPVGPPGWPDFPILALDSGLADGWYSYRVSGVDLFGRHSDVSDPCPWYQWAPVPEPRPWYYQDPPGLRQAAPAGSAYAVLLRDQQPPPMPTAVEAMCLDPADPTVLHDQAYLDWRAQMRTALGQARGDAIVGLRCRWVWTAAHEAQAPDLAEFRIYLHPGRLNAHVGRIQSLTSATDTSDVVTTIGLDVAADALVGAVLQVGSRDHEILSNGAGLPLRVTVQHRADAPVPRAGQSCAVIVPRGHAAHVDFAEPTSWFERHYVVLEAQHWTGGVDDAGAPVRIYDVFVPQPGDAFTDDVPLVPSLAEPVAYGHVGVSAADGRAYADDDPYWASLPAPRDRWSARQGNEGRVSAPATVFRVRRERPPPPVPPPDAERVFATPADYHGHSWYTVRWVPAPHLRVHVYRALDEAVFQADWAGRDWATLLSAADATLFPDPAAEPRWDGLKRQQVVDELNALKAVHDGGGGLAEARALYRALSNDALRVLASTSWTASAFTQRTTAPLDPDDAATANRRGPSDPDDFVLADPAHPLSDPGLRVYDDRLDGRTRNRFFYRAAYVDGAHTRSRLGASGAPVWLPDVIAPRAPVFTAVRGDERAIQLRWASNREPDLTEYRVYRADRPEDARDPRTMTQIATVVVAPGDPSSRPAEVVWLDAPVPGLRRFWYVVVAVDGDGNASTPSRVVPGRAHDTTIPVPPLPQAAWVTSGPDRVARISWQGADETLLQRRAPQGQVWMEVGSWRAAGTHAVDDVAADPAIGATYRLWSRSSAGAVGQGQPTDLAPDTP